MKNEDDIILGNGGLQKASLSFDELAPEQKQRIRDMFAAANIRLTNGEKDDGKTGTGVPDGMGEGDGEAGVAASDICSNYTPRGTIS